MYADMCKGGLLDIHKLFMATENTIMHMDLDTFFVSVERKLDSRLNGKPVLIGGVSDRGVVAACSYEARAYGVHSAMPMRRAKELCPDAIQIRGNSGVYSDHSNQVTEIIKEKNRVRLETVCSDNDKRVLEGEAVVLSVARPQK